VVPAIALEGKIARVNKIGNYTFIDKDESNEDLTPQVKNSLRIFRVYWQPFVSVVRFGRITLFDVVNK